MTEKQENNTRGKRFIIGIAVMIFSSAYGWIAVFGGPILSVKYGRFYAILGIVIYAVSWVTFLIGGWIAGPAGFQYVKQFWKKVFRRRSE